MKPRITVWHGESGSVFYIVDDDAPDAQQPCILAAYRTGEQADETLRMYHLKGEVAFAFGSNAWDFAD